MAVMQEKEKWPAGAHYTYADYLGFDDDFRAEIIDGALFVMDPPATYHQDISMNLSVLLGNFLAGKPGKVYAAPFGVRLFPREDHSDKTVLEPDLVVLCDRTKLDQRGCNGAPDMVIEILSPSTARKDVLLKFYKYLRAGVREYWVIDPDTKTVQVNLLDQDRYDTKTYRGFDPEMMDEADRRYAQESIPVTVLPGLVMNLEAIFAE
jgi:Uma2 family endonuclease